jgi:hypothetical protein
MAWVWAGLGMAVLALDWGGLEWSWPDRGLVKAAWDWADLGLMCPGLDWA